MYCFSGVFDLILKFHKVQPLCKDVATIIALFAGIKNARFKAQVTPGDVLEMSCEIIARKGPVGVGKAEAYVDGKLAVSAELTFAIE